jgi:hypothetical protein
MLGVPRVITAAWRASGLLVGVLIAAVGPSGRAQASDAGSHEEVLGPSAVCEGENPSDSWAERARQASISHPLYQLAASIFGGPTRCTWKRHGRGVSGGEVRYDFPRGGVFLLSLMPGGGHERLEAAEGFPKQDAVRDLLIRRYGKVDWSHPHKYPPTRGAAGCRRERYYVEGGGIRVGARPPPGADLIHCGAKLRGVVEY